jgi:hypothetical protein
MQISKPRRLIVTGDIIGPTPKASRAVFLGTLGLALAAIALTPGFVALQRIMVMPIGLGIAAFGTIPWVTRRSLPAVVVSHQGVSFPLARISVIPWEDLAAIQTRTASGRRFMVLYLRDPFKTRHANPALTSSELWLAANESPMALDAFVDEIRDRYEAARGAPLPQRPTPAPSSLGLIGRLLHAAPGKRMRGLMYLSALSAALVVFEVVFVPLRHFGTEFGVAGVGFMIGMWDRSKARRTWRPWDLEPSDRQWYASGAALLAGLTAIAWLLKHW